MERVMTDMHTDMMKNVTQTTDLMRNVMQATQDYNAKALEFASANCNATVDYFSKLASVKSPSDLVDLTTNHMRVQTDALSWQVRELMEITQKLVPTTSS
jgi:hypothetical protein